MKRTEAFKEWRHYGLDGLIGEMQHKGCACVEILRAHTAERRKLNQVFANVAAGDFNDLVAHYFADLESAISHFDLWGVV